MPELPEVEVTRRSVSGLQGARIQAVRLGKPLRWPLGIAPESLVDCRVGEFQRRGKYLWLPLTRWEGCPAGGLLWHLGMSGSLSLRTSNDVDEPGPHDHVDIFTDRGLLRLHDPRRFGAVVWSSGLQTDPAHKLLASLGAEPFDLQYTAQRFHADLQCRRKEIKPALMAGDMVVGAGNIYASDALFEAGIDPRTPCRRIGLLRAQRLLESIRTVLTEAIEAGGSTLRDFRDAHGSVGQYQGKARVYGRQGESCVYCGTAIRRIVQAQRATYFCPRCQRR
jgi:formamidopyrimidine-DNA glycosylase